MYKHIYGVTLIELMIAMSIGILVLGFIFEIYLASQRSYRLQLALSKIQNNATKAIAILNADIRKAGAIGCARLSNEFPLVFYPGYSLTESNKVSGNGVELKVRYVDYPAAVLTKTMVQASTLFATKANRFAAGDKLLISDCTKAEIFQVDRITILAEGQKIITSSPLHNRYEKNAEIGRLTINKFFVAKTNRLTVDAKPIYALFVEDIHHRKIELVEGIYQIAFLYSQLKNGKIIETENLNLQAWHNVIGIAVKLQLASPPLQKNWYTYVAIS